MKGLKRGSRKKIFYISVDIDVLDPASAPATYIFPYLLDLIVVGTPEIGGWTTKRVDSDLKGIVGG